MSPAQFLGFVKLGLIIHCHEWVHGSKKRSTTPSTEQRMGNRFEPFVGFFCWAKGKPAPLTSCDMGVGVPAASIDAVECTVNLVF